MPVLQNTRQELFCQSLFQGMTQTDAAVKAGYSVTCARSTGSSLMTNPNVKARLDELKDHSANERIMSRREKLEKLSEIAKETHKIKGDVTHRENMQAIHILNRMQGDYQEEPVAQDNRQYNVFLMSAKGKADYQKMIEGVGTIKEIPEELP